MRTRLTPITALGVILGLLCLPEPTRASGSLTLTATTDSLEVATSSTAAIDYRCSFADNTTTALTPGSSNGQITTATDTTLISAPGASTQRKVSGCSLYNTSTTVANTLTVMFDTSGTERVIVRTVLAPNWTLIYNEERDWSVRDSDGREVSVDQTSTGFGGVTFGFYKVGSAAELIGGRYHFIADTGLPGAWVPGTPGLNGDAVSCDTSADAILAGAHILPDPSSGGWYLTQASMAASQVSMTRLVDLLWYNTGITVTTTTEQAITHPGIPARDLNGSTNGEGLTAGLLATAAIGGGAVTNTTLNYTDESGNAGRTATMASWNASSVVDTIVEFQLAAGDRGIRSIQGITLGTTYTSGSLSLLHYRPIANIPQTSVNVGGNLGYLNIFQGPGVRIWNDSCLVWDNVTATTTANNISGSITLAER